MIHFWLPQKALVHFETSTYMMVCIRALPKSNHLTHVETKPQTLNHKHIALTTLVLRLNPTPSILYPTPINNSGSADCAAYSVAGIRNHAHALAIYSVMQL